MSEHELIFSSKATAEAGTFKLLELPPELCKLTESCMEAGFPCRFTIRGEKGEDAVLCTASSTYAMRTVLLSNSVLVVTPLDASTLDFDENKIAIRDQVNSIIELSPIVPRLQKLAELLKGNEYNEASAEEDAEGVENITRTRIMYEDVRGRIQASDEELERGLRDRRILNIHGELRPVSPPYLKTILEAILTLLVSYSIPHNNASVELLSLYLDSDHEIPRSVSAQVMLCFGTIKDGFWTMDVNAIVRQVGLGLLRPHVNKPISRQALLTQWRDAVGDTFSGAVALPLLAGNFLTEPSDGLTYYPSASLPTEPARRFADLFLVRSRWKADDIAPFLEDITMDQKEREKLLLKYARAVTDPQSGVLYTARAQYAG
ncbi:hypothetical protein CYLTODRAFT_364313 [Cylindrobasidium torrendii FP15055 ss-10]|uniref:Sister chromatid cohesion protein DCC1 n=1 Tax=Cylindrobasidium torrendii FP15055 ss-10 TaxID=1314674 RepID=A0A0D7BV30_9AGAR|nr:hypothetical protein CYLTODRAFT_364313 [Cylindrobasidium torrendii FP15055 ss-10]